MHGCCVSPSSCQRLRCRPSRSKELQAERRYPSFPQTVDNATNISAIKTKTDALPSDPADASDVAAAIAAISAKIDTVDDFLDTEIAAIKAKTDSLTFTVAGVVDANIQRANDVTVTGTGAPGDEWGP